MYLLTCTDNRKGKLQERLQKLGLAKPSYKAMQDGSKFQAEVTIPLPDGSTETFATKMMYGTKKEAEQGAAKVALEKLAEAVGSDVPKQQPSKTEKSKTDAGAGATPKADKTKAAPQQTDNTQGMFVKDQCSHYVF